MRMEKPIFWLLSDKYTRRLSSIRAACLEYWPSEQFAFTVYLMFTWRSRCIYYMPIHAFCLNTITNTILKSKLFKYLFK